MKIIKKILKIIFLILIAVTFSFLILFLYSKFFIEIKDVHDGVSGEVKFQVIGEGEEIAYMEIDNKSPTTVVFVGGLSGWSGTWKRTMESLDLSLKKENVSLNLLAIDLPPFGYSKADLSKDFFRNTQAKRINAFLDAKDINNVIFVGHSYGAGPATEAAMQQEDRVRKLVIIDGVLNIGETRSRNIQTFFDHTVLVKFFIIPLAHFEKLVENRLESFVFRKENIDEVLTKVYMSSFETEGTNNKLALWLKDYSKDPLQSKSVLKSNYESLKFPVRIIWGDQDTLTPISLIDDIVAPDRKIYILKDVGHIPMIEDYKESDYAILEAITE